MIINIAICDDEELCVKYLEDIIRKYGKWGNHTYKLHIYTSSKQLIDNIRNDIKLDIAFMDVKLDANSLGTDIGIQLKTYNPNLLLVYMSFYDLYYEELVKAEPFDFIHKPISENKLYKVLDKAVMRLSYIKHEFVYKYKSNGITHYVDLNKVLYFESQHRIINIYCTEGSVQQFYAKLDDVEKDIDEIYPCFLRANKSYFVNFNYITNSPKAIVSISGLEIKVSRKYKQTFDEKFDKIVENWYI